MLVKWFGLWMDPALSSNTMLFPSDALFYYNNVNSNFSMSGYEVQMSNLRYGKEGILIAVKNGTCSSLCKVHESDSRNLTTFELNFPKVTLRVIILHGPQESETQDVREEFYNDLDTEIERALSSECKLLLVGDFNY